MEGALHTFVTPISKVLMFGDYQYQAGHGVIRFAGIDGRQTAREVLLSAAVQMDFENDEVMLAFCKCGEGAFGW